MFASDKFGVFRTIGFGEVRVFVLLAALQIRHLMNFLRVCIYIQRTYYKPITGSSRELGSTLRGGFLFRTGWTVLRYVYAPH